MAAELAGLELIPAVVRNKPTTEAAAMEIRLIENLARESLRPLELSAALDQLIKVGALSVTEVGKRIGMKPAAVSKSLSLLQLPESIRGKIDAGVISAGAGYELTRVADPQLQTEFSEQVSSGSLTRDGLAGKIKSIKRRNTPATETKSSRVTAKLTGGRLVTVCGGNLTVEAVIKILEELLARCRSARSKGLALRTMLNVLADEASES
jgi:ParB-like chromosome segregation protein Spo0J